MLNLHSVRMKKHTQAHNNLLLAKQPHMLWDMQQCWFQGVSIWQHTQAHIPGHTLLFAYMHIALALSGSHLPDDTNSLQNNLICLEICNSAVLFEGVLRAKDTHHHIFGNRQLDYCMRIAVCSCGSQLPMLPSLHTVMACSGTQQSGFWGCVDTKTPVRHICGKM